MSKHGVENLVALATTHTLDKNCSPINFSKSDKVPWVLLK